MESEKRFQQICKNLCLLLTAILHFVHTMVQPVLMSISASRNTNKSSHFRVSHSFLLTHRSSSYEAWLDSECCWRQQSYAIKNQLRHPKLAGSLWHKG